ncbi:Sec-independent protein translocase protein TatB [Ancylobacter defluvii]|uniref:Sec-independent protein translocase protein TatB n=1 Tax=Ancylobacter defluvii TaxID=1282440 RepID=A0A9W6NAH2_9HYPH|nr:Sec-independent protein translocase protein TatB [Ancylobacter defluvii]MBS7587908.1 Sec-independent protein translocase protein TatB [Ancylobacter defluvii]GLK83590.1 hypothetical protein GCM10017653_16590 [Ancylobacter defluvii]
MFDIGWSEMLVIGVVALIVIGPKELPGVIRNVGRMVGKLRRMAGEFQGTFQEALREADLADVKKTLSGFADDTQNSISSVRDSVAASIPTNPLHDIEQQLKDAATPVERKDLPAPADPTAPPSAPEATELEPNAFESIEAEVRDAADAIAEAPPQPVAVATATEVATSAEPAAKPQAAEPEIAEAVADLDHPPVAAAPTASTKTAEADVGAVPAAPAGDDATKAKGGAA